MEVKLRVSAFRARRKRKYLEGAEATVSPFFFLRGAFLSPFFLFLKFFFSVFFFSFEIVFWAINPSCSQRPQPPPPSLCRLDLATRALQLRKGKKHSLRSSSLFFVFCFFFFGECSAGVLAAFLSRAAPLKSQLSFSWSSRRSDSGGSKSSRGGFPGGA